MKKFFRSLVCILAAVVMSVAVVGCGPRQQVNPGREEDESKTNITVGNYGGGFGVEWLNNVIARFEEKYKDVEFEPGKKGVQVNPRSDMTMYGSTLLSGTTSYDVYFTESTFYRDVVAAGKAADITDIVTEKLTAYGEERSIADKLGTRSEDLAGFFKIGSGENVKYYGLPHYEAMRGMVYDVDLFDEKGFWLATDGSYIRGGDFATAADKAKTKANGPDGLPNTYDDGLPATFDEFFALCDRMVSMGVTPMTYSGQVAVGATLALYDLYGDYTGKDDVMAYFNNSGTVNSLVNSMPSSDYGVYSDMMGAVNLDDGGRDDTAKYNLLKRQAGRFVALDFAKRMMSKPGYYRIIKSEGHTDTQLNYLLSRIATDNPIAFIMGGNWWENEAADKGSFAQCDKYIEGAKQTPGGSRMMRKFGWMPFPKYNQAEVDKHKRTMATNCNHSLTFIGSATTGAKLEVAKKFLQFCYTDEELQNFTVATGTLKPLDYTVSPDKTKNLSYFAKQFIDLRKNPNVDIVYTYTSNPYFVNNYSQYYADYFWSSKYGANPFEYFKDNPDLKISELFDELTK